jgi:uncharacterized protein with NAD-binding domain and iron-sulfur cluster
MRRKPKVAILGGGMAGMVAAWRLSDAGWQDELASITVYQRGWRLGGKGASSRGRNGRIEEHGLHLWLGYYENAFRVLRECYVELDRSSTDPGARLLTWQDAMIPTADVGLEDYDGGGWHHWIGRFRRNDELPGEPGPYTGAPSSVDFLRRALLLVADFLESLPPELGLPLGTIELSASPRPSAPRTALAGGASVVVIAAVLEALARLHGATERQMAQGALDPLDRALADIREALHGLVDSDADVRRTWHLVSVMTACVRGVLADRLLSRDYGFRAINNEDFLDWIVRHGAAPEVADFAFIRGLYDLVFAERGEERARRGVSAGIAVFMTSKMFFEYKGAIFWKMAAGMGDVVFAPMYQALRRRGVTFEFFHRVDALHVAENGLTIDAITMGRQVALRADLECYEPLVRVGDLPSFPDRPLTEQLVGAEGIEAFDLESYWCTWTDAEQRVLRRGFDFDAVVLAIPVGMASQICGELAAQKREWAAMIANVATTATQAVQLWFRDDERAMGWQHAGATVSAYAQPFNTWASMDQLIAAECWPEHDRPGAIAYFCGALDALPPVGSDITYPAREHAKVRENVLAFIRDDLPHLLPGFDGSDGPRWERLCGARGVSGPAVIDTQFVTANVDPSDRYVMCVPGSDGYRLRSDESGYDNLFLAGDWTDNGLNAGCIEAATLSGLQAANAILGRPRTYRIAGSYLW